MGTSGPSIGTDAAFRGSVSFTVPSGLDAFGGSGRTGRYRTWLSSREIAASRSKAALGSTTTPQTRLRFWQEAEVPESRVL
jgi:hypothetical protein